VTRACTPAGGLKSRPGDATPGLNGKPEIAPYFAAGFALAASQSALDIETQPVPLQLFMPLQLFFADLHSEVPLQEFTPEQCTFAASAATDTVAIPEVNSIAAAAAIAVLDSLVICII
jgi:hypothetical protein